MWLHRPPKKDAVGDFFAKELQFTTQQSVQFETLKKEHHKAKEALKELQEDIKRINRPHWHSNTVHLCELEFPYTNTLYTGKFNNYDTNVREK